MQRVKRKDDKMNHYSAQKPGRMLTPSFPLLGGVDGLAVIGVGWRAASKIHQADTNPRSTHPLVSNLKPLISSPDNQMQADRHRWNRVKESRNISACLLAVAGTRMDGHEPGNAEIPTRMCAPRGNHTPVPKWQDGPTLTMRRHSRGRGRHVETRRSHSQSLERPQDE
jgi:hypothetical protein